jgi:hypothetical protein
VFPLNISTFDRTKMKSLLHIKVIALSLLLIFSASVFAVCPCNHDKAATIVKHQCCCKKALNPAAEKSTQQQCPCEKKIIKFHKTVKQLTPTASLKLNVLSNAFLLHLSLQQPTNSVAIAKPYIKEKIFHLHQAPEYYIMYQALRI